MTSAKSSLGHSEAGAGALGILRIVAKLEAQSSAPLAHLRTLNPHVLSILQSSQGTCEAYLPRQVAPGNTRPKYSGISSFAFQVRHVIWLLHVVSMPLKLPAWLLWPYTTVDGDRPMQGTNAHLLVCETTESCTNGDAPTKRSRIRWLRKRYWHMAGAHPLLCKAQGTSPEHSMRAHGILDNANLAILRQNQVSNYKLVAWG